MMKFTDIFIARPVLALVISMLLLLAGLTSLHQLPVRQYPATQQAVLHVKTAYLGADAEVIAGFITTPLEHAIAQANGIDYLSSSSTNGLSSIDINLQLNYDPLIALADINARINSVTNILPPSAQAPVITITNGDDIDVMYIGFKSDILATNQITEYLIREIQPKLQTIPGVQVAEILGDNTMAMRIWLDPAKLAGFNLSMDDINKALLTNNITAAVGRANNKLFSINLSLNSGLHTPEDFKHLVIKTSSIGAPVYLRDVVNKLELGAQNYDRMVSFNGQQAVYIGIKVVPSANVLAVLARIKAEFPELIKAMPHGIDGAIVYDASRFIDAAIHMVFNALVEAFLIVSIVVALFLGSLSAMMIPIISIPLSLVATFFMMQVCGYSINLLTLLALLLAIGLVVDDAIIMVENINRHLASGKARLQAAMLGARELAGPIIAISIILIVVYMPIGFMGGLTGALFTEFAFTLAGAVAISAVLALTLVPMLCSQFLSKHSNQPLSQYADYFFTVIERLYHWLLLQVLAIKTEALVFVGLVMLAIVPLFMTAHQELAPAEDQGLVLSILTAPPNANLTYIKHYSDTLTKMYLGLPDVDHVFQLDGLSGLNNSMVGLTLKPWQERRRTSHEIQAGLQAHLAQFIGIKAVSFEPPPLPGASGLPVQVVLKTIKPFVILHERAQQFIAAARASGIFLFLDSNLNIDQAQSNIVIDRTKAADLGIDMRTIGTNLAGLLSQQYLNYFNYAGRAYQVITAAAGSWTQEPQQILNYNINNKYGDPIALSTIAHLATVTVPQSLNHFQELNAVTISALPVPGVTLSTALNKLRSIAATTLPEGYSLDYAGQSRQLLQNSNAFVGVFILALCLIFLCLAALFESFRDPVIMLISVPMSIFGALIFLNLGIGSLNIYTEVGLVTLIGIISKHGILLVEFANKLQAAGHNKYDAIVAAASIRLRPILMTTAAMILGVVPLLKANGAGAAASFNISVVLVSGIAIGTILTIFVVPAMYLIFGSEHYKQDESTSHLTGQS